MHELKTSISDESLQLAKLALSEAKNIGKLEGLAAHDAIALGQAALELLKAADDVDGWSDFLRSVGILETVTPGSLE